MLLATRTYLNPLQPHRISPAAVPLGYVEISVFVWADVVGVHEGLVVVYDVGEVFLVVGGGATGHGDYVEVFIEYGDHAVVFPPGV